MKLQLIGIFLLTTGINLFASAALQCLTSESQFNQTKLLTCKNENDVCITHIHDDKVGRGCLIEVAARLSLKGVNVLGDCENDEKCVKCSEDYCNDHEPFIEHCISCDSKSNKNCSVNLSDTLSKICPKAMKPLGCYMAYDESNNIHRDCIGSLDKVQREHCLKESDTCKYCLGENCNKEDRFQFCHACNSKLSGKNCILNGQYTQIISCKHYTAKCYTNVENNIVYRGCVGDDIIPSDEHCKDLSRCETCTENTGCNDKRIDFEKCIVCNSINDPTCRTNTTFTSIKACPLASKPMGCYHLENQKTDEVKRGCLTSLTDAEKKQCLFDDECKQCMGDNCNSRKTLEKCIECNSDTNPKCISSPKSLKKKICYDYKDKCFTFTEKNKVQRGCSKDMSDKTKMKCKESLQKCEQCTNEKTAANQICNTRNLLDDTCIECSSDTDPNCFYNPAKSAQRICSVGSHKSAGCYLHKSNNVYQRGCVQDARHPYWLMCGPKSNTCKTCLGKNCNVRKEFQSCYTCGRDDIDCILPIRSSKKSICTDYYSTCLTGIDKDGYTFRECIAGPNFNLLDERFQQNITLCSHNNCNNEIYPYVRLQCHQTNGEKIDSINFKDTEPMPCRIYSEHDQCYTYLDGYDNVYRGCLTDQTSSRLLCEKQNAHCTKCEGNGCNDKSSIKKRKLSPPAPQPIKTSGVNDPLKENKNDDQKSSETVVDVPKENLPSNSLPQNNLPTNSVTQNSSPSNNLPEKNPPANRVPQNNTPTNSVSQDSTASNGVLQDSSPTNSVPPNNVPTNDVPQNSSSANTGPLNGFSTENTSINSNSTQNNENTVESAGNRIFAISSLSIFLTIVLMKFIISIEL